MHNLHLPRPGQRPCVQLAIESIGMSCSLAILRDLETLHVIPVEGPGRAAAELAPHLNDAIRWAEQQTDGIDLISVANGPGSFTGLRVGVTSAKTLAYAIDKPLVAVPSLAAHAAAALAPSQATMGPTPGESKGKTLEVGKIVVGLNAYRQQVFCGEFDIELIRAATVGELKNSQTSQADKPDSNDPSPEPWWSSAEVLAISQWHDRLSASSEKIYFAGDAFLIPDELQDRYLTRSVPLAVGVGRVGAWLASVQEFVDPLTLLPDYLRSSAAEEKVGVNVDPKTND